MIKFSFLKSLKENNNYKRIKVSFDSIIDGYEIVENKGKFELIGMDTEKCKLKNFEKEVKKFIRREIYNQNPEINALTDLSLDFRLNHVYISGKKSIIRKIQTKEKSSTENKLTDNTVDNTINNSNKPVKEKQNKSNANINTINSNKSNNSKNRKKTNNKKKKKKSKKNKRKK